MTRGTRVSVDMKPGMPLGRFLDEFVIETDHPLKPELKIRSGATLPGRSPYSRRLRCPACQRLREQVAT